MALSLGPIMSPIMNEMLWAASDAGIEDNFAKYGIVSGLFSGSYSIGDFVGPTVSSALVEEFGFPWATTFFGGFILFYTVVLAVFYLWEYYKHLKRRRKGPSTDRKITYNFKSVIPHISPY
ncbi:PREDICTED: MFS-type transporter SLC18B1-like [Branchiostoma belcheri]|uniref:MFS-type transporter SLC18B1-like n=1 Tax=Branchiostoma belcheri TaxID=7741 RepID=A0A6P4Z2B8_BRABE|nr:PREDICTED: MFS-type transporter SLC18B1-like [Branchiostoma belcheri]